ncbi:MAG: hypothetical protein JKX75_04490 [Gammaproteobacteria bacterium]|nr:hypothetical protein [Gammaproteobacteria bacterium]
MKYDLKKQATLLFGQETLPLTQNEWQMLAGLLEKSQYQHVIAGDANEDHSVWVSRYFNDVDEPVALNELSADIEAIVMSDKMRAFYKQFIGTDKICLRRCQANRLYKGDYIGVHKDQDSSPDYIATIVFHFSNDYVGGYFISSEITPDGSHVQKRYKPYAQMALVNNCSISHRVTAVESGERLTLACFLSASFSANMTSPSEFAISSDDVFDS